MYADVCGEHATQQVSNFRGSVNLNALRVFGHTANSRQIDRFCPVDLNNLTITDRAPNHEEAQ
jgi:hypothetical protein